MDLPPRIVMTKKINFFDRKFLKYVFVVLALVAALLAKLADKPGYRQDLVVKVYDGDTVQLASGEKVRLIGIDTPEEFESNKLFADSRRTGQDIETIKAMGHKAHLFTSQWVLGQKVLLEFDHERKDKYGRLLAYLYLPFPHPALSSLPREGYIVNLDGKKWYFINATIIQAGYAVPMAIAPNDKYKPIFQALYQQAREYHLGLWDSQQATKTTRKSRLGGVVATGH